MSDTAEVFEGWAILELMGHRRLAGYLREQTIGGSAFLRIDVPKSDGEGNVATQFYAPSAVYCITPTTETLARQIAKGNQPAPVQRWELPPAPDVVARPVAGAGHLLTGGSGGERRDEILREDRQLLSGEWASRAVSALRAAALVQRHVRP